MISTLPKLAVEEFLRTGRTKAPLLLYDLSSSQPLALSTAIFHLS